MDGNCDVIEGVLDLYNREPVPGLDAWLDSAITELWTYQGTNGLIEGTYLDGNFARTTLLYCLWKTQGMTLRPWRKDVRLGAHRADDIVRIVVNADTDWRGRIQFDRPRHRDNLNLPLNWGRVNQFSPEWITVDANNSYIIENVSENTTQIYTGEELQNGLALQVPGGGEVLLVMTTTPVPPGDN